VSIVVVTTSWWPKSSWTVRMSWSRSRRVGGEGVRGDPLADSGLLDRARHRPLHDGLMQINADGAVRGLREGDLVIVHPSDQIADGVRVTGR
jgi:hypothetical protein